MTLSSEALLHMRPGRRRQIDMRRGRDGKSDGERPESIRSIAVAYRIKHSGATVQNVHFAEHASTIGRLMLEQAISPAQAKAARRYAGAVAAYNRLMGIPSPHPRALDLLMAGKGQSCEGDTSEAEAGRIKGVFRNCRRTLLDCGASIGVGSAVNRIAYGVAVENWPLGRLGPGDLQNLRCGLNSLARVLG